MGAILINDLNSGISGITTILSPKPDEESEYGTSVSINNSGLLAVGTRNVGRVYIHNLNDSNPSLPRDSLPGGGDFGWSIALGDDGTLVVGAPQQDGKGAVYLYRNGNFANSPVTINAPSAVSNGGQFGFSVALDGNTLVVGAPYSSDAGRQSAGTVFTYNLNLSDDDLVNQARALDANPNQGAEFGRSVSITSGAIVVGSRKYEQNDLFPSGQGAIFFYNQKTNGDWYRPVIVGYTNPIIGVGSQYGDSVAIGDTAFLVGIPKLNDQAGSVYAYFYTSSTATFPPTRSPSNHVPPTTPPPSPFVCQRDVSCTGIEACKGTPPALVNPDGSCNGDRTCKNENTFNGQVVGAQNTIDFCSCNGEEACINNRRNIGSNSW
jgi:hypothetical protein